MQDTNKRWLATDTAGREVSLNSLPSIPPLESGDRLTRAEFERRYRATAQPCKAELIEGVVYVASPVRINVYAQPHAHMVGWTVFYEPITDSR